MDVKGSARQGWVVDLAPADLQNDPTNGGVISPYLPIKLLSLASPSSHLEGVKSGCSNALKPGRLGLNCKANKCTDAGTGGLGVLNTHETSPCRDDGSTRPGECRLKYKYVSLVM